MKLSSKSRYGLRAMVYIAERGEVVSLASVARDTATSEAYLEQLFSLLKKASLVKSVRGANGGYKLAKAACKITIGEIVRALEDELEIVDCISGECESKCNCISHRVWRTLYDAINNALDSITLAGVLSEDLESITEGDSAENSGTCVNPRYRCDSKAN